MIEFALAHTLDDKTEAAYRRSDALEKRRVLMREWADFVIGVEKKIEGDDDTV